MWISMPPPSPSAVGARSAADQEEVFKYKKASWANLLILLNPKRQILSALRQIETVDRQKSLALLTVVCHGADC
jgi:hypothetical protein